MALQGMLLSFQASASSCYLEFLDKVKKQIWRTVLPMLSLFNPWLIVKMLKSFPGLHKLHIVTTVNIMCTQTTGVHKHLCRSMHVKDGHY